MTIIFSLSQFKTISKLILVITVSQDIYEIILFHGKENKQTMDNTDYSNSRYKVNALLTYIEIRQLHWHTVKVCIFRDGYSVDGVVAAQVGEDCSGGIHDINHVFEEAELSGGVEKRKKDSSSNVKKLSCYLIHYKKK